MGYCMNCGQKLRYRKQTDFCSYWCENAYREANPDYLRERK